MKAKIISLVNQKGGVGKTTSAINVAASLTKYDKKVLLIDLDSQGNASQGLNIDKNMEISTMFDVLTTSSNISSAIQKSYLSNLDVVPANINLVGAEKKLLEIENSQYTLKEKLIEVIDLYDYIIVDCPPSLSTLTINSLSASDSVLIPVQCEFYAVEGLTQLLDTIILVIDNFNVDLTIEGVLPTMFDRRLKQANLILEDLVGFFGEKVFEPIPRTTKVAMSPIEGVAMIDYDKNNLATQRYLDVAREVINNG